MNTSEHEEQLIFIYVSTTYLAQAFDLYVHMFTRLNWIWKGVG